MNSTTGGWGGGGVGVASKPQVHLQAFPSPNGSGPTPTAHTKLSTVPSTSVSTELINSCGNQADGGGGKQARESSSLPEVTQLMGIAETDQVANPGGGPSAALCPLPRLLALCSQDL